MERRLQRLQDVRSQWESYVKARDDFAAWLSDKEQAVREVTGRPAKLHAAAAEAEIERTQVRQLRPLPRQQERARFTYRFLSLQDLAAELRQHEPALQALQEQHTGLTLHRKDGLIDPVLRSCVRQFDAMLGRLDQHSQHCRECLDLANEYHSSREGVEEELEVMTKQCANMAAASSARDQLDSLRVSDKLSRKTALR